MSTAMNTKINVEGALLFEQPFARIPYETHRKVFRTSQRHIERDMSALQTAAAELARQSQSSGGYDPAAALKSVDGMIGRVEGLKRKLSDLHETQCKPAQSVMRERYQHLDSLERFATRDDPEFGRWADTRLDRWLVDWALRSGKTATARKIAEEKCIEKLVDIDLFTEIRRIEDALRGQSCTEALGWCSENKAALRKIKCTLEFDLRLQEYIELARARRTHDAKAYMNKHMNSWLDTHVKPIKQAAVLLAVPPDTKMGPYKRLYDPARWSKLVESFRLAVYQLNALPTQPLLSLALYSGLASLRIPACYNDSHHNPDCPVCDRKGLRKLADEVPWSHHANSTIVCLISGKIMDEDNPPMAFKASGNVYSREALLEMAGRNGGRCKDPRSGEECEFGELRKVFIS